MPSILIVGATRGLGASLARRYASSDMDPSQANTVYGTTRSDSAPDGFPDRVKWLTGVDLMKESVADDIVERVGGDADPFAAVVSCLLSLTHGLLNTILPCTTLGWLFSSVSVWDR